MKAEEMILPLNAVSIKEQLKNFMGHWLFVSFIRISFKLYTFYSTLKISSRFRVFYHGGGIEHHIELTSKKGERKKGSSPPGRTSWQAKVITLCLFVGGGGGYRVRSISPYRHIKTILKDNKGHYIFPDGGRCPPPPTSINVVNRCK